MAKEVVVLEVSNATVEQIQTDLGQAFTDFCEKHKGAGIKASVLQDKSANKVIGFINGEENKND